MSISEKNWKEQLEFCTSYQDKTFINTSYGNPPDSTSELYTKTDELKLGGGKYNLEIQGKDIILKQGSKYFKKITENLPTSISFNTEMKLKNITIACDILEIHDELKVPECSISIFARKLIFKSKGCINTSALPWSYERAKDATRNSSETDTARNGADARHAGNVNLFVRDLIVEDKSKVIIKANGGNGQDAGKGLDGKDGKNVTARDSDNFTFTYKDWKGTKFVTTHQQSYYPPYTYLKYEWFANMHAFADWEYDGVSDVPTDGENAKKPGKPGEPGNAGNITSNQSRSLYSYDCNLGKSGSAASNVRGGRAGTPKKSAQYELHIQYRKWSEGKSDDTTLKKLKETETKDGESHNAPTAEKKYGKKGQYHFRESRNAWVHPSQLQIILKYARNEYLANSSHDSTIKLKEILSAYSKALDLPVPPLDIWDDYTYQIWSKSKQKIASIIAKINGNKDYFDNPIGYVPALSLASAIKLYSNNIDDSLRALILATYFQKLSKDSSEFNTIVTETSSYLKSEAKSIKEEIEKISGKNGKGGKIKSLEQELQQIEDDLQKQSNKLGEIETRLRNDASKSENETARMKFGLKMGSALLQLIPYGQPALGVVGNISSKIADNWGEDFLTQAKGVNEVLEKNKLGDVISKTRKGFSSSKKNAENQRQVALASQQSSNSEELRISLEQAGISFDGTEFTAFHNRAEIIQIPKNKPVENNQNTKKKENNQKASKWLQVGNNLSPAISNVTEAFEALSVPESQIFAAADQLKAKDKEWNEAIEEIKKFTKKKTQFFQQYAETLELLSNLSHRMQNNIFMSLKIREEGISKTDFSIPEFQVFSDELKEQAEDQLIYNLYLMTKAYEVFSFDEKSTITWGTQNAVLEKITSSLNKENMAIGKLEDIVKDMKLSFMGDLNEIKNKITNLIGKQIPRNPPLLITINEETNRDLLEKLREDEVISFNPFQFGHILPSSQHMKIQSIDISEMTYESISTEEILRNNTAVNLAIRGEGLIRSKDRIYVFRGNPSKLTWNMTSEGKWRKAPISHHYEQLLDMIFKDETNIDKKDNRVEASEAKRRLSLQPAWSDMEFWMTRVGIDDENTILSKNLKSIVLKCTYEQIDVSSDEKNNVIDLRSNVPGANFTVKETGLNNKITKVSGQYYVITNNHKIEIVADQEVNDREFVQWKLIGLTAKKVKEFQINTKDKTLKISFNDYIRKKLLRIYCIYKMCDEASLATPDVPIVRFSSGYSSIPSMPVVTSSVGVPDMLDSSSLDVSPKELYASPQDDSPIMDVIEKNMILSYTDEGDIPAGWAMVTTDILTGFIKKDD